MKTKDKNSGPFGLFGVVEGGRVELEAEIVEDLFLGRYDPAKASRLDPRGKLRLVHPFADGSSDGHAGEG